MQWWEYLIIVFVVLFVGSVIFLNFYLKKKGKSLTGDCCSSNCKHCNGQCNKVNCQKMLEEYHDTYSK